MRRRRLNSGAHQDRLGRGGGIVHDGVEGGVTVRAEHDVLPVDVGADEAFETAERAAVGPDAGVDRVGVDRGVGRGRREDRVLVAED